MNRLVFLLAAIVWLPMVSSYSQQTPGLRDIPEIGPIPNMQKRRLRFVALKDSQGRLYAVGGDVEENENRADSVSTIERFIPGARRWEIIGRFQINRLAFAAAMGPNDQIYIFGGITRESRRLDSVEVFDPRTGQSQLLATRVLPRWSFTATTQGNRILLIGGDNSRSIPYTSPSPAYPIGTLSQEFRGTGYTEAFSISEESVSLLPSRLNIRRYGHAAVVSDANRLFVFGGRVTGPLAGESMPVGLLRIPRLAYLTEGFNLQNNRWIPFAEPRDYPYHSFKVGRVGLAAAKTNDGKLLAIGGAHAQSITRDISLTAVESFNPQTGQWADKAELPEARSYAAAVTASDGRVIVLGGMAPREQEDFWGTRTVFEYDPQRNRWTE